LQKPDPEVNLLRHKIEITLNFQIKERSLFRAGEGVDDIREGLWIFGEFWRRGYGISTENKGYRKSMNTLFIPRNMALLF